MLRNILARLIPYYCPHLVKYTATLLVIVIGTRDLKIRIIGFATRYTLGWFPIVIATKISICLK